MRKVFSSCFIFLICIFQFNCTLKSQVETQIHPCDLMFHGRDVYQDRYPDASDFPLSRISLPVEFSLNESFPKQYRSIVHEAASEWNETIGFELITISDELDRSTMNTQQQNPSSKNVIYWLTEADYGAENMTLRNNTLILGGKTLIAAASPLHPSIPYVFILKSDIVIYEQSNDPMKLTYSMFTSLLKGIGIHAPEDMDVTELQNLFIDRLSNMNSDSFYNMVIQMMEDKGVVLPSGETEDIQEWIIKEINEKMENIRPLVSFEDLQNLMIAEYSYDLTNIFNSSVILKNRLLHEFGHALGLDHNNEPGSLMYDALNISLLPQFPRNYIVPKHIDQLALYGLSCSYNSTVLR